MPKNSGLGSLFNLANPDQIVKSPMTNETFKDIEKLESDLWEAADSLHANLMAA